MVDSVLELVEKERKKGYTKVLADAKVCQDILLYALSKGPLSHNVTVKGGVVMRSKSHNIRRATLDLDIDFIRYSLSDESLDIFVDKLNCVDGITITRIGEIEELKQQDYHGKRIYIQIYDSLGYSVNTKIDLGVHNKFDINQEEYCFDIAFNEDGASLLINPSEQMFVEKLRSLLKFGPVSTRYKDIFDMYYLIDYIDKKKLKICLCSYIYQDTDMKENSLEDIIKRVNSTFGNQYYQKNISTSNKRWIDEDIKDIFMKIELFLLSMKNMMILL
ncbi:MAG: nucleotidyl transferase AbiEii/AbiGii toxin family protein [Erysipelotrichaceae bacterium]|nr:nucleotidyl transferase AbiEii/AbiGii toxin family protein [Erysipelotrichaceae bacterium]